jgi:hypothetical protein
MNAHAAWTENRIKERAMPEAAAAKEQKQFYEKIPMETPGFFLKGAGCLWLSGDGYLGTPYSIQGRNK